MPVTVPGIAQPIAADTNTAGEAVQRINTDLPVVVDPIAVAAATVTPVVASGTVVPMAANNTARRGLIIYNDSDTPMVIKYGAGASSASFTVRIAAFGYWEMPHPIFTGQVTGIWEGSAPSGTGMVTES